MLATLVAVYLVSYINSSLHLPLLVSLAEEFGTSVADIAQVSVAISLPWAVLAPLIGPISDRYGRKPVLLCGVTLLSISAILTSFAWDYTSLLVFRFVGGLGGAAVGPTGIAFVGDCYPARERGRAFGWLHAGFPMGAVIGLPITTYVIALSSWRVGYVILGVLWVGVLLAAYLSCPNPRMGARSTGYFRSFPEALGKTSAGPLLLVDWIMQVSFFVVQVYLAAFVMLTYGLDLKQMVPILAIIAVGRVMGAVLGGRLADAMDRRVACAITVAGYGLLSVPFLLITPGVWFTTLAATLFSATYELSRPSYTAMIAQMSARVRGTILGLNATANQMGTASGSAIGGMVLTAGGYPPLAVVSVIAGLLSSLAMRAVVQLPDEEPGTAPQVSAR